MALFSLSELPDYVCYLDVLVQLGLSSEPGFPALGHLLYLHPNVRTTKRRFLPSRGLLLMPSPAGMAFGDITQPSVNICLQALRTDHSFAVYHTI